MESGKPAIGAVKPVNKLLSKPAGANVLNSRSIFVPETKTVVVRTTRSIVVDSPVKGRDSSAAPRSSIASLAKIGVQHFGLQSKTPSQTQTSAGVGAGRASSFLTNASLTTSSSRTVSSATASSNPTGNGGGSGGSLSQLVRNSLKQTANVGRPLEPVRSFAPPAGAVAGGLSARVKARATSAAVDNTGSQAMIAAPPVRHLSTGPESNKATTSASIPANPTPAPARAVPSSVSMATNPHSNDSETTERGVQPQPQSGEGLSGLFQSMGKTLAVKSTATSAIPAAVKARLPSVSFATSHHAVTGEDAGLYGERQCVAAGNVGAYLDTVISSNDTTRIPSGEGLNGDGDLNTVKDGAGVEKASKSSRKGAEKADTYSNYVRKNLKSGGTSKYLNRKASRVSMAKQRWLNRSGGDSSGGGGKYDGSKYNRKGGKYQSSGNADDHAFSGGGDGNAYSKPRGLQQWGLDSLDMSLDLIAAQISGAAPGTDGTVVVTADGTAKSQSISQRNTDHPTSDAGGGAATLAAVAAVSTGTDTSASAPVRRHPTTASALAPPAAAKLHPTDLPIPSINANPRAPTKLAKARSALATKLNKAATRMAARVKENERIQAMTALAPKCPGHGMASKLLVVKKSGPNKGRYFYSCTFPAEQRCNFFMWAEDSPELLRHSVCLPAEPDHSPTTPVDESDPAVIAARRERARREFALQTYATKLRAMNRDELKQEVLNFNRRTALCNEDTTPLRHTGTKEDLVARLLRASAQSLYGGADGGSGDRDEGGGISEDSDGPVPKTARGAKITRRAPKGTAARRQSNEDSTISDAVKLKVTVAAMATQSAIADTSKEELMELSDEEGDGASDSSEGKSKAHTINTGGGTRVTRATRVAREAPEADASPDVSSGGSDEEVFSDGESLVEGEAVEVAALEDFGSGELSGSGVGSSDEEDSVGDMDTDEDAVVGISKGGSSGATASSVRVGRRSSSRMVLSDDDSEGNSESDFEDHSGGELELDDVSEEDGDSSDSSVSVAQAKRARTTSGVTSRRTDRQSVSSASVTAAVKAADVVKKPRVKAASRGSEFESLDELEILLRRHFGFDAFRPGQRWAIERCLAGHSSLLVMPTGAGKSLCYMLPALALPGLTLVVSPLIALMQDQQRKLPFALPGACLSGSLTAQQIMQISESVLKGHIKVLFVSPERLCTPAFRRLIALLKQQRAFHSHYHHHQSSAAPVVSLVCVDEAHCLSQWSYNFRPAFLRIRREIQFIQPAVVLALTATATPRIQVDVMKHLGIPSPSGLLALPVRRDNLQVSVHTVGDETARRQRILDLVQHPVIVDPTGALGLGGTGTGTGTGDAAEGQGSDGDEVGGKRARSTTMSTTTKARRSKPMLTIVYVWRRFEADALAEYLKGCGVQGVAVYHAGIDAGTRARTQLMFDRGKVHCIVATVAFGMGVDKADVRQVIHCTMPKSIESYMQEMGRAGRDGMPSACHLLLQREDAVLQHSLSHSSELSRIQIAALLAQVFQLPDRAKGRAVHVGGMADYLAQSPFITNVALPLERIESSTDISSAAVETILSVLELPPYNLVVIEGTHFDTVKGRFRRSTEALEKEDILVAAMVGCNTYKPPKSDSAVDFELFSGAASGDAATYDSSGMSGAYGLGFDSSASATNHGVSAQQGEDSAWLRDRRAGGSYGGKIQEFECSRLAVAARSGLTPDEVSNGLYKLQKAGVLEYRLQDSALYVRVVPPAHSYDAHHFEAYARQHGGSLAAQSTAEQQLYPQWIWYLADAVRTSLQRIADGGSQRIVDMWRATSTIAQFTASNDRDKDMVKGPRDSKNRQIRKDIVITTAVEPPLYSPSAAHSAAQSLLSHVMNDADGSHSSAGHSVRSDLAGMDDLSTRMLSLYLAASGPFEVTLQQGSSDGADGNGVKSDASKLRERVRDSVSVLQRDPSVMTVVNNIMKASGGLVSQLSTGSDGTKPVIARRELQALCICRILHALPTRLLPATVWRDRSDVWGSYKHVAFEELYAFVLEQLGARVC